MKRTYTTTLVLFLGFLLFNFGRLTGSGSGSCTRHSGLAALNNNPTSNCAGACHGGGGIVTDSLGMMDTTSTTVGTDTTTTQQGGGTTGVGDLAFQAHISIYPTVTTGKVCITTSADSRDAMMYGVYTLDGRLVDAGMLPGYPASSYMNIQALPAARYIIRISNGSHSASYHLIRQ
ncbi:MAG: T9SS type A sorting domain-containing protein [Bacteroidetes bacterium]|nr:T9SS type A sorting domain-containing protein [Bacteroidota bacterium]